MGAGGAAYYGLTTAVLAALLYVPVARLVWVLSVRRLERRRGEPLGDAERAGQRNRARFIAVLLVVPFAALFNHWILRAGA